MNKYHLKLIALFLYALLCNACNSKTTYDENMKEKKIDLNRYSIARISDHLVIRLPASHNIKYFKDPDSILPIPVDLNIFKNQSLGFSFFMPYFTGYTQNNYKKEFDEDRIEITIDYIGMGAEKPDAPGFYPPNMIKRIAEPPFQRIDLNKYEVKHGLRCYQKEDNVLTQDCYGLRDEKMNEYILLDTTPEPLPSWVKSPKIQARYFTPQYGGLVIIWRAHMKHFVHWKEIDAQIWKFIAKWNISPNE